MNSLFNKTSEPCRSNWVTNQYFSANLFKGTLELWHRNTAGLSVCQGGGVTWNIEFPHFHYASMWDLADSLENVVSPLQRQAAAGSYVIKTARTPKIHD